MMNKRGQVTVIIIVGLIILISILGIVYFKKASIIDKPPEEFTKEDIPIEVQEIREFVEDCLAIVAEQGFRKAGLHGGYVYTEGKVAAIPMATESNSVEMFPGSDISVPYWYYLSSSNGCKECAFSSNMPNLLPNHRLSDADYEASKTSNVMLVQMNEFVNENIHSCVNHFEDFKKRGWKIEELDTPKANIIVGDITTIVNMRYPIRATKSGVSTNVEAYSKELDFNLREIYRTAARITEVLSNVSYMERFTKEMIAVYSFGEDSPLPPMHGGVEFEIGSGKYWTKTKAKNALQEYISDNLGLVQVLMSYNNRIPAVEDRLSFNMYQNLNFDIRDPELVGTTEFDIERQYIPEVYSIDFIHLPFWDFYLDIQPSQGELISPDSILNLGIVPFGLQRYDYTYDVSYPIIVKIESPIDFDEPYIFQFAYEVNMRNNNPLESLFIPPAYEIDGDYKDLFCSANNEANIDYDFIIRDAITKEPIEDAVVSYSCVTDSCYLGQSILQDGKAVVNSPVYQCYGAQVDVFKDGYQGRTVYLGDIKESRTARKEEKIIELYSPRKLNVVAKMRPILKGLVNEDNIPQWKIGDNLYDLSIGGQCYDDVGMLVLSHMDEEGYMKVVTTTNGELDTADLELIPGKYKVESYMFRERKDNCTASLLTIPEDERTYSSGLFSSETVILDPVYFNESLPLGLYSLSDSTNTYFEVDPQILYSIDTITLTFLSFNPNEVVKHEDLSVMGVGADSSFVGSNKNKLMPILS